MEIKAGKYYILDSHNELVIEDSFDTKKQAVYKAQELADKSDKDDVYYICPTEQQEHVEFLCAEYVIRVNNGEDYIGCYVFDEER